MERIKEFFKSKGFYIAMGTGVAALATLIVLYNYSSDRNGIRKEKAIDLNQPANEVITSEENAKKSEIEITEEVEKVDSDAVIKSKANKSEVAEEKANIEENSNKKDVSETENAMKDTSETAEKEMAFEEEVSVKSDEPVFNYNGEQCLEMPVIGDVIIPYSMDTTVYFKTLDSYKCNPGMLIKSDEGTNVYAACEGKVASIEETKEHGSVVTIDMGNGYIAKYGQLMDIAVSEGDIVGTGENIGEIAPVTSYYTLEGNHLYFEIAKDGESVNPASLFK